MPVLAGLQGLRFVSGCGLCVVDELPKQRMGTLPLHGTGRALAMKVLLSCCCALVCPAQRQLWSACMAAAAGDNVVVLPAPAAQRGVVNC